MKTNDWPPCGPMRARGSMAKDLVAKTWSVAFLMSVLALEHVTKSAFGNEN